MKGNKLAMDDIFRKETKSFQAYVPGKPVEEVKMELGLNEIDKLASNENQLGPSPKAVEAVRQAAADIHFYPEAGCPELRRELAEKLGVAENQLVFGNGGEELIQLIAQTFINQGDEIITADPTFGIYGITAGLMGATTVRVSFKDKDFDLPGMAAAINPKTKLIYLCSPNNPTGNYISKEQLEVFLQKVPSDLPLLIDEAYYEFAVSCPNYPDTISLLAKRPRTIILRTFSKISGIAGVRIGYLISSVELATELNKIKLTFGVNRLAQEAARGALKDEDHLKKTLEMNRRSLDRMMNAFNEWGLDYFPSAANFIFVDTGIDSRRLFDQLLRLGTIVRPGFYWGWDNWIRVSTGTTEQTERFIQRLKKALDSERPASKT